MAILFFAMIGLTAAIIGFSVYLAHVGKYHS
jgi:hypothetical protein